MNKLPGLTNLFSHFSDMVSLITGKQKYKLKILFILISVFFITQNSSAQNNYRDSLLQILSTSKADTVRVNLLYLLSDSYSFNSPDSGFLYARQGLELSQEIGYKNGEINCKLLLGFFAWSLGDFATAIKLVYSVLEEPNIQNDSLQLFFPYIILSNSYRDQGDYREALQLLFKYLRLSTRFDSCKDCGIINAAIGSNYYGLEKYDSALIYLNKSISYPHDPFYGWITLIFGRTHAKLNNDEVAFQYYRESIKNLTDNLKDLSGAYGSIGTLYQKTGNSDSAIYFGKQALLIAQRGEFNKETLEAYLLLANAFEKIDNSEALHYYKLAMDANNTLFNQDKQRQITSFKFNEDLRQRELKAAEQQYKNKINTYILIGMLISFLAFMIYLLRNIRQKQKARIKIEKAYNELKATQEQLIQFEKMASLGELTAGIAHEIQNPLNFVNNFSEINKELIDDLQNLLNEGKKEEAISIANDLKENEEKINHHGKRADAIVKGMLQHSRASTGQKEPTDINALTSEFLRLSYHGLRVKEKTFYADLETDLDNSIDKIKIIPQDIGRVLLNIFNNAFYSVYEKKNQLGDGYVPKIIASTKRNKDKIEIIVNDNGSGITQEVLNKIFQPFFTTKPTGQGTGLGLSLSYDIIKAHGGEIRVRSKAGEGAEFIILLPF